MEALPSYIPQLWNPTSNIAGLTTGLGAIAPLLNPNPTPYYAYDGTPIGYGNDCDPISMEPELSGMIVPDVLEETRFDALQEWAMPLLVGTMTFAETGRGLPTALWALGAYMAPVPVAMWLGWQITQAWTAGGRSFEGLGQHWPPRRGPVRTTPGGRRVQEIAYPRPGPWRQKTYCAKYGRARGGVRRCIQYKKLLPREAYEGGKRRTRLLRRS